MLLRRLGERAGGAASSVIDSVGIGGGVAAAVGRRIGRASPAIAIGGRAAPWNPTWSASAGRKPRPFWVRTWTIVGPGSVERPAERLEQRVQVVARHEPDVGDAEVLEQLAGLGEVDDRLAQPAGQLEGGPPMTGSRSTARS